MAGSRFTIAALAVAGLLVGAAVGWALKPLPVSGPPPGAPAADLISDALATLEDLETRSAGVVEILDDMIGGNVSPTALEGVRDSMQEIVEGLGDVRTQIIRLRR